MSDLIPFLKGRKWGFATRYPDARIAVDCVYDEVGEFHDSLAPVCNKGKWGLIDTKGEIVLKPTYDRIATFSEGMAALKMNDKWGFIDKDINVVIDPKSKSGSFDAVRYFQEGRASVMKNGKCGFIDRAGRMTTDFHYDDVDVYRGGYASVELEGRHGCIDLNGNRIYECKSEVPVTFNEGLAVFAVSRKGETLNEYARNSIKALEHRNTHHSMEEVHAWQSQMDRLRKNLFYGYIDTAGSVVIDAVYEVAFHFQNGIAATCLGGRFGYIGRSDKDLTERIYEDAHDFNEGLARVRFSGKTGFIRSDGEKAIDFVYDNAWDFSDGYAKVKTRGNPEFFVDARGNELRLDLKRTAYGETERVESFEHDGFSEGLIAATYPYSKIFFVDKKGNAKTPEKYLAATPFVNGLARANIIIPGSRESNDIETIYLDKTGKEYYKSR